MNYKKLSRSIFIFTDKSIREKVTASKEGRIRCSCMEYITSRRCEHVDVIHTVLKKEGREVKKPRTLIIEEDDLITYREQIASYLN